MTQPVKQDERVLDYIYGELDEGERSAFEAQLAEDAALREEVESLQGVGKAFRGLPKVTQSPDSVQRMTALLMQQAAQTVAAQGRPGTAAKLEEARVADEGAKVIPLRGRPLRRIFTSPASGIFAAAAAALFWVVLKSQGPTPVPLPSSPQKLEPALAVAPPPTETPAGIPVPRAEPAKTADELAQNAPPAPIEPDAPNVPIKTAFSEALKKEAPAAGKLPPPTEPTTLALASKSAGPKRASGKSKADLDSLLDANEGKPAEKKPLIVAMATPEKKAKADDYDGRRFAQPPPPMKEEAPPAETPAAKPSVRQQMAQAGDRRKDRIVEELANQELGNMPGRGAAAGSAPPAAAPPPPPASPAEPEGRYAQAPSPTSGDEQRAASGGAPSAAESQQYAQNNAQNYVQNLDKGSGGRRVSNMNDGDSGGNAMLQTVHDQLRQGRCAEAHTTLTRLEQSFPATAGLAEARAQWQRSCQLVPQNQAPTPAVQMPQLSPSAPKPAPRMDLEQAYSPSQRSSMPMNKAPAYRAKKAAPPPTQQQKVRANDKAAADAL